MLFGKSSTPRLVRERIDGFQHPPRSLHFG